MSSIKCHTKHFVNSTNLGEDVSFLTHCAVFKAANFEEIEKLNGTVESKN